MPNKEMEKTLKLKKTDRDDIVRALQSQTVPAPVGMIIMQISQILMSLPEENAKEDKAGN